MALRMWTGRTIAPPTVAELKDIEKWMELPPSAHPVGWRYDAFLDYTLLLKVEIDTSELQGLIENSPFDTVSLSSKEQQFFAVGGGRWWDDADKAQRFLWGRISLPRGAKTQDQDRTLDILVDMDRTDVYVVYLALFSD